MGQQRQQQQQRQQRRQQQQQQQQQQPTTTNHGNNNNNNYRPNRPNRPGTNLGGLLVVLLLDHQGRSQFRTVIRRRFFCDPWLNCSSMHPDIMIQSIHLAPPTTLLTVMVGAL